MIGLGKSKALDDDGFSLLSFSLLSSPQLAATKFYVMSHRTLVTFSSVQSQVLRCDLFAAGPAGGLLSSHVPRCTFASVYQLGVVSEGAGLQVREKLPALVQAVQNSGQVVTWICDPMHGNTESCSGFKTRRYQNIRAEVCVLPGLASACLQVSTECTSQFA